VGRKPSESGRRPLNRLLGILILVSLAVHALIFVRISGLYDSRSTAYIELEVLEQERPSARSIPRPPKRPDPPVPSPTAAPVPTRVPAAPRPFVPELKDSHAKLPATLVEPLSQPENPQTPALTAVPWAPTEVAPPGVSAYGASGDYFGMVRLRIERNKRYPSMAIQRRIQGKVIVRFVIESDGRAGQVGVVEPSPHAILNEAAVEAVRSASPFPRPPRELFTGPVTLEVAILFELT